MSHAYRETQLGDGEYSPKDTMTAALDPSASSHSSDSVVAHQQGEAQDSSQNSSRTTISDDASINAIAVLFPGALPTSGTQIQISATTQGTDLAREEVQTSLPDVRKDDHVIEETGSPATPARKALSGDVNVATNSSHDQALSRKSSRNDVSLPSLAELEPEPGEDRPPTPKFNMSWPDSSFAMPDIRAPRPQRVSIGGNAFLRSRSDDSIDNRPLAVVTVTSHSRSTCSSPERRHLQFGNSSERSSALRQMQRHSADASNFCEGFLTLAEKDSQRRRSEELAEDGQEVTDASKAAHLKTYFAVLRELQSTDKKLVHLDLRTPQSLFSQQNNSS